MEHPPPPSFIPCPPTSKVIPFRIRAYFVEVTTNGQLLAFEAAWCLTSNGYKLSIWLTEQIRYNKPSSATTVVRWIAYSLISRRSVSSKFQISQKRRPRQWMACCLSVLLEEDCDSEIIPSVSHYFFRPRIIMFHASSTRRSYRTRSGHNIAEFSSCVSFVVMFHGSSDDIQRHCLPEKVVSSVLLRHYGTRYVCCLNIKSFFLPNDIIISTPRVRANSSS